MPNAVTFKSTDGFTATYPLQWLYDRKALIATKVGGEPLSESFGGMNQLWIEGAAARVFVRDIVSIEFCDVDDPQPPSFEADDMLFQNRPNAGIILTDDTDRGLVGEKPHPLNKPLEFEGYAYDFDRTIAAVEFSLDQGASWTRYETPGSEPGRWVWWRFTYTPVTPGAYELLVRAVNEDGKAGTNAARYEFETG